jgi:YesN/AraC family two-component response regulator
MEKLPDYSSKRFLIVDDEHFMLGMIERMLKQCQAGLILKAPDGAKALQAVKDNFTQVDCIIADFNMKPVNGLQLLQGIRLGVNPKIPREQAFIMLTGHADTDVVKAALALDVHGYVVKPVAPEKLFQTLDKVFRRTIELKEPDFYRGIKLPAAQSPFGEEGAGSRAGAWTILSRVKPFKSEADVKQKIEKFKLEHATQDGVEAVKLKNRHECKVNELREGQILAQNIEAEEGVILLREGTHLTKGMIARLKEIAAETEPNQTVQVGELVK